MRPGLCQQLVAMVVVVAMVVMAMVVVAAITVVVVMVVVGVMLSLRLFACGFWATVTPGRTEASVLKTTALFPPHIRGPWPFLQANTLYLCVA